MLVIPDNIYLQLFVHLSLHVLFFLLKLVVNVSVRERLSSSGKGRQILRSQNDEGVASLGSVGSR